MARFNAVAAGRELHAAASETHTATRPAGVIPWSGQRRGQPHSPTNTTRRSPDQAGPRQPTPDIQRLTARDPRYLLLWFTRLPPDFSGTFAAIVYDVRLHGIG